MVLRLGNGLLQESEGATSPRAKRGKPCRKNQTDLYRKTGGLGIAARCAGVYRADAPPVLPPGRWGIMNAARGSQGVREAFRGLFALAFLLTGGVLRSGLAVLLVCAVLTPAARAFEWCPNDLGPDAYCLDGWACCPYPYGPGYWC